MIIDCILDIKHIKLNDNSFLVVKVGSDSHPATAIDIADVQRAIEDLQLPKIKCLVTHHHVDLTVYAYDKGT